MTKDVAAQEAEIARRRWRNMMIAAQASGKVEPQQRRHLEAMRKTLGIPLSEASSIASLYKREGGGIRLFGDHQQRLELFRDILTMMLADGKVEEKESKLIVKLADHLDIDEDELEQHMEECRQALVDASCQTSARMSTRIFRRLATESSRKSPAVPDTGSYDNAAPVDRHLMQLTLLESLTSNEAPLPNDIDVEIIAKFEAVASEDKAISQRMVTDGVMVEQQLKPYYEDQQKAFRQRGRITSFLTAMVNDGLIEAKEVQALRGELRKDIPISGQAPVVVSHDNGEFTMSYWRDTLDQSFFLTVAKISGQADHHTVTLMRETFASITQLPGSEGQLIILDLSEADYISSAAIGAIIECRALLQEKWGDIRFVNLSPEVEDVIRMLGVDTLIVTCSSLEEALWSFASFSEVATT